MVCVRVCVCVCVCVWWCGGGMLGLVARTQLVNDFDVGREHDRRRELLAAVLTHELGRGQETSISVLMPPIPIPAR